jgi:hypothetical protein
MVDEREPGFAYYWLVLKQVHVPTGSSFAPGREAEPLRGGRPRLVMVPEAPPFDPGSTHRISS